MAWTSLDGQTIAQHPQQFYNGNCMLHKEEAAFRGALDILMSSKNELDTTRAVGQATSVFQKMKDEIEYLRDKNGISQLETPEGSYDSDKKHHLVRRQWSEAVTDTTATATTTTTTRRPKSTRSPEIKTTLTTNEQALFDAANRGWDVTIASLCAEGINASVANANNNRYTPLHLAVAARHLPAALTLIRCGANVNAIDSSLNTPLHLAIANSDPWMSGLLLLAKASYSLANSLGTTAAQLGLSSTNANIVSMFNATMLPWYAGARRLTTRETLSRQHIQNGYYSELVTMCFNGWFDPNVADTDNSLNTALHVAATSLYNHPMLVQTLVRCGGHVNVVNNAGNTPLHLAISNSNAAATAALLLQGADPYVSNYLGLTSYTLAKASTNTYIQALFTHPRFEWYLDGIFLY